MDNAADIMFNNSCLPSKSNSKKITSGIWLKITQKSYGHKSKNTSGTISNWQDQVMLEPECRDWAFIPLLTWNTPQGTSLKPVSGCCGAPDLSCRRRPDQGQPKKRLCNIVAESQVALDVGYLQRIFGFLSSVLQPWTCVCISSDLVEVFSVRGNTYQIRWIILISVESLCLENRLLDLGWTIKSRSSICVCLQNNYMVFIISKRTIKTHSL